MNRGIFSAQKTKKIPLIRQPSKLKDKHFCKRSRKNPNTEFEWNLCNVNFHKMKTLQINALYNKIFHKTFRDVTNIKDNSLYP